MGFPSHFLKKLYMHTLECECQREHNQQLKLKSYKKF